MTVHAPPLPIPYGTHHSKFFLLKYATGVRVVIHSANLIFADCNNKTQALFFQDFPFKAAASGSPAGAAADAPVPPAPAGSDFAAALLAYIRKLAIPADALVAVEGAVHATDFSSARVALVASTPGRHCGAALSAFGHMRARAVLAQQGFAGTFRNALMACQFSSLGSLTQPWLEREFAASLSAGRVAAEDGGPPPLLLSLCLSLRILSYAGTGPFARTFTSGKGKRAPHPASVLSGRCRRWRTSLACGSRPRRRRPQRCHRSRHGHVLAPSALDTRREHRLCFL